MRSSLLAAAPLALLLLLGAGSAPAPREAPPRLADRLVLDTRESTLTLYEGETRLQRYRVGLGRGGLGKERRGDGKTPLGRYRLMRGRASKSYLRFLPVSYPGVHDAKRGLKSGLIDQATHDRILAAHAKGAMPPQGTKLGGAIGIHGYGQKLSYVPKGLQVFHRFIDGTLGCVLLSDREVQDLEKRYVPGATLIIR
ncbi:MAG: L,D-transpeptidase [Deltaproteobacteria bacterium]|nr:L,D-transpeptidase [Deltaproteobacteria bacterium]